MDQAKSDRRMLWRQLSGVKSGSGSSKGVEVETVPVGLIMQGEGKIEEIRVELPLEPSFFSKKSPHVGLWTLAVHL